LEWKSFDIDTWKGNQSETTKNCVSQGQQSYLLRVLLLGKPAKQNKTD
jgi:hypothetical protein